LAARNNNEVDGRKEPIGVRQPLASAMLQVSEKEAPVIDKYAELIKDELNVKQVGALKDAGDVTTYALNPIPALLGKKFGKDFPKVQKLLRTSEQAQVKQWAESLLAGKAITAEVDGSTFEVTPEECEVLFGAAEGYTVAEEKGYLAAVDITMTEELVLEGLAREVVRRIQSLRKDADFDISDNIQVVYDASANLEKAIAQFSDYIKTETLAVEMNKANGKDGYHTAEFKGDEAIRGEELTLGVKRVN
jgi:isoleucyl-tRNA synthetase